MNEVLVQTKAKKINTKALKTALNAEKMVDVFLPLMKDRFGDEVRIENVDVEILRQRTKRSVMRYRVNAVNGKPFEWRVIGKVFTVHSGEIGFDNMKLLWENGFSADTNDAIVIPEPYQYLPAMQMFFQEDVAAPAMRNIVRAHPTKEHFIKLARAIAKLHRCPAEMESTFTVKNHLLRCHPKHGFLVMALPKQSHLIDFIVERAYALEATIGNIRPAVLHGDFHLGQVHVSDDRTWVLDFDTLSYGDPASDLGNLLVFLKGKARRNIEMYDFINAFLDEYFKFMDPAIADRIPMYEGLTHLRRACKCLRLQEPGWEAKAIKMIEKGAEAIGGMRIAG